MLGSTPTGRNNMTKKVTGKQASRSAGQREAEVLPDDTQTRLAVLKKLRIIIRTAAQHSAWIDKQCGVNGAQLWIMQELLDDGELRVGELTTRLAVHQTTTSNLVDDLEKRGYVSKARSAKDQRVVTVKLTRQGKSTLAKGPKPGRGLMAEALRQLQRAELDALDNGLQGLLNGIETLDEEFGMQLLPFML
jgi:DNA-binding MarR family transcriptional regulator